MKCNHTQMLAFVQTPACIDACDNQTHLMLQMIIYQLPDYQWLKRSIKCLHLVVVHQLQLVHYTWT
jgi:hypothetical protein